MDMVMDTAKHLVANGKAIGSIGKMTVQGSCEGFWGRGPGGGGGRGMDVQQEQQQGTLQVQSRADSGADTKGGSGHDCAEWGVLPCACPHAGFPSTPPPLLYCCCCWRDPWPYQPGMPGCWQCGFEALARLLQHWQLWLSCLQVGKKQAVKYGYIDSGGLRKGQMVHLQPYRGRQCNQRIQHHDNEAHSHAC